MTNQGLMSSPEVGVSTPFEALGEHAIEKWRRRAVDVFMLASLILHTPAMILWSAGYGPTRTVPTLILATMSYASIAIAALLRRSPPPVRVWILLAGNYPGVALFPFAVPAGPLVRILPVTMPTIALVLVGIRSGRVAAAMSATALWFYPLVNLVWGKTASAWTSAPTVVFAPGILVAHAVVLTAVLLTQLILLERFFDFLAMALSNARQESERRREALAELARQVGERARLEREVTRIGDEERRRLGQDVHDGVCQQLTAARLRCQALERKLVKSEALRSEDLGVLGGVIDDAIDEAQAVARGLCPLRDDPAALADALRLLVQRTQETTKLQCRFVVGGEVAANSPAVAQQLYRIAQEALTNAVRHSQASRVELELAADENALTLRLEDDGKGLPRDARDRNGLGLRTMPYRAQTIHATLAITAGAQGGTRIICRVPWDSIQQYRKDEMLGRAPETNDV